MTKRELPDLDTLNTYLQYDERTGTLSWKNRTGNQAYRNGTTAGRVLKGTKYRIVRLQNVDYYEHRLAFKIAHGYDPDEVDHKLPNGSNVANNLRDANSSQNKSNRRGFAKSGHKGVVATRNGRYMALITYNKTQTYLGTYDTPEEAHDAYSTMAHILFGEFANTGHIHDGQ